MSPAPVEYRLLGTVDARREGRAISLGVLEPGRPVGSDGASAYLTAVKVGSVH